MKLTLFLLLSVVAYSQPSEPFKRANVVLVTYDTMSVNTAFSAVGRTLLDMGYTINKTDRDFQTIETNARNYTGNLSNSPTSVIVRASVKTVDTGHTEVKITGTFDLAGDQTEITYRGMKGSAFMVGFEKIQAVAKQLAKISDSQITYAFQ